MLIDCDTCTARGTGCGDCVVTVLLGAPPSWQTSDPVVVPLPTRPRAARPAGNPVAEGRGWDDAVAEDGGEDLAPDAVAEDLVVPPPGVVVEFDEVERRAVRALADVGLVPPLRHQPGGGGRRTG